MQLQTLTNMLPCGGFILYKNFPPKKTKIDVAIKIVGTPNPRGKQSSCPKHFCVLSSGVTKVEIKDPKFIEK
jgi:hypothetical protein